MVDRMVEWKAAVLADKRAEKMEFQLERRKAASTVVSWGRTQAAEMVARLAATTVDALDPMLAEKTGFQSEIGKAALRVYP